MGYVDISYQKLVTMFGPPNIAGDGYKVQVEWGLVFEDGTIATIYDWKESKPPELVTEWHIGGLSKAAVSHVMDAIKAFDFNTFEGTVDVKALQNGA